MLGYTRYHAIPDELEGDNSYLYRRGKQRRANIELLWGFRALVNMLPTLGHYATKCLRLYPVDTNRKWTKLLS